MKIDISIICPVCSTSGKIQISKKDLGKASRGLLSISIPEQVVCEHSFIAYIDRNFKVRDYFVPDFEISLRGLGSVKPEQAKSSIGLSEEIEASQNQLGLPKLPENCKPGDLIEQEYNDDLLLSYIFTINKAGDRKELFSFSILVANDQKSKLYKLVIKDFIAHLKQAGLLSEDILKNHQKVIYSSFNKESDIEIKNTVIPLSKIFKEKKKKLKELRMKELKGSFF
jgi:hypothetical protein